VDRNNKGILGLHVWRGNNVSFVIIERDKYNVGFTFGEEIDSSQSCQSLEICFSHAKAWRFMLVVLELGNRKTNSHLEKKQKKVIGPKPSQ